MANFFRLIFTFLIFPFSASAFSAVDSVAPLSPAVYVVSNHLFADCHSAFMWATGGPPYTLGAFSPTFDISGGCPIYNASNGLVMAIDYSSPGSCPFPSSGASYKFNPSSGMCERPLPSATCRAPQVLNTITNSCSIPPKFKGFDGAIVCLADGTCSGNTSYNSAAAACASYDAASGGVSNEHSVFTPPSMCKTWFTAPDGSTFGTSYFAITNAVPCNVGDTVCAGSVSADVAAAKSQVVSSVINDAVNNGGNAASAVGASPTQVQDVKNRIAGQIASQQTLQQSGLGFPSDYARSGEAAAAASLVSDAVGKVHSDLSVTSDQSDPVSIDPGSMSDFGTTFDSLKSYVLPTHTSSCVAPTIDFSAVHLGTFVLDAQCTIATNTFSAFQAAMMVVWSISALFIVLKA